MQEYEYKLQANPDYWETCETLEKHSHRGSQREYEVKLLAAETAPEGTLTCSTSPFASMIETKGTLANTFRIKSIGYAGSCSERSDRSRTFAVTGFLDYIYFTNFEDRGPRHIQRAQRLRKRLLQRMVRKKGANLNCQNIDLHDGRLGRRADAHQRRRQRQRRLRSGAPATNRPTRSKSTAAPTPARGCTGGADLLHRNRLLHEGRDAGPAGKRQQPRSLRRTRRTVRRRHAPHAERHHQHDQSLDYKEGK